MTDYPDHEPIQPDLKQVMNEVGQVLDAALNPEVLKGGKRTYGFAFLSWGFEREADDRRMNYISNADREDVRRALNEFLDNMAAQAAWDSGGKGTPQ